MKAIINTEYGSADVLKLQEIEKPTPKPNEVLVKIYGTTVNRTDTGLRSAEYFISRLFTGLFKPRFHTLGSEFAGIIEQIGESVKSFKVGDEIIAINGVKIPDLIKKYLPITPASNYETQLRDLPNSFLLKSNDEIVGMTVLRDNVTQEVQIPMVGSRTKFIDLNKNIKGYDLINNDIGYVYPAKYKNTDLPAIKKLFANAKAMVIDMRCYPSDFMPFTFGSYIKKENIQLPSIYFAHNRDVIEYDGQLIAVSDFIEIDEEITSLNNYIHLQQMRYAGAFDYKIIVDDELDLNETLIPPMLIQPFVENAIEHGFRNINYKGLLIISFKIKDDFLTIEIDDNGSGLKKSVVDKQKKQSLAQIILKERLDLLFNSTGQEARFDISDKKDKNEQGVMVTIVMPELND